MAIPPKPVLPLPPPPKMPLSLHTLESYLEKNHLRLLDFFKRLDRDKDWCVTLEDLKSVTAQCKIPLSEADCSELFSSFDVKKKGQISYKQMLKGVSRWSRKSTRSTSHLSRVASVPSKDGQEDSVDDDDDAMVVDAVEVSPSETQVEGECEEKEGGNAGSGCEVVSTLGGLTGELSVEYVRKLQGHFADVCKLCKEQDAVLSLELLERGAVQCCYSCSVHVHSTHCNMHSCMHAHTHTNTHLYAC